MAKHPWLTQRGSVYYLRASVPKDIRDTFGKTEVIFSLRTSAFKGPIASFTAGRRMSLRN